MSALLKRFFTRRGRRGRKPARATCLTSRTKGGLPGAGTCCRFAVLVILICLATGAGGASIGPSGYAEGFNTTAPSPGDWSTATIAGAAGDVTTDAGLDAAVQLLAAGAITTPIATDPGNPPGANALAAWSSSGQYLQTRPTGVKMAVLMATLVNNTGADANALEVSYDFTNATTAAEEIRGHRLYYSLSGAGGTWENIPALNSPPAGRASATVALSSPWNSGARAYLLWADDNGSGSPDDANQIDNFFVSAYYTNFPLALALTLPSEGQQFATGSVISASVALTGSPTNVSYYVDGALAAARAAPPFTPVTLPAQPPGSHTLYATAQDANGALASTATITFGVSAPGTVFFVVGSDTAIWNYPAGTPTTVDAYTRHPHYKQDFFTAPAGVSYQVMAQAFRDQFKDSFGQSLKITWWMMGGNIYRDADNLNVPLANTMTLHLMKQYHGDRIQQLGDELSLHYHTFIWKAYKSDGISYWNQSPAFNDCRADFDVTLAQYLLEEGVFPVSFRSGWHYMDNDWQAYLNELLPYCLHDDYGVRKVWAADPEPIAGVEDWSQATSLCIPFHPSATNYQVAGSGRGWNARSIKMQNLNQTVMNRIFAVARGGTNEVVCLWNHLPENFLATVTNTAGFIQAAVANYPGVSFRYCTAVEAMQRWLGASNQPPPQLDVSPTVQGDTLALAINVNEPIFQAQPFVAVCDVLQGYRVVPCQPVSANSWVATLPVPLSQIARVGVAVTDNLGNLATRILRYLPDDAYLDNRDAGYAEVSGSWRQSPAFAWGLDARVAPLTSNDTARAQWSLPVSTTGRYNLFAQVPTVTNAAANVSFTVSDGGANPVAQFAVAALPPGQWVYVGSPVLEATRSNVLAMAVSGSNQPNTYAVADVIKLAPAVAVPPRLENPRLAGTTFSASVATQFGLDYFLEYQTAAGDSAWTLAQSVSGNGISRTLTDSSADSATRFYRVRAQWR